LNIKKRLIANSEQPVGWVIGFIFVLMIIGYFTSSMATQEISPFVGSAMMGIGSVIIFGIGVFLKRQHD
jgi:biotin transporter BioY